MHRTLGDVDGQTVVEVNGAETYPTSGQLRMTTVSVNDEVTLFGALGLWASGRASLAPRDEYFGPGQTTEDLERENSRLKRIVADQALNLQVLKDVLGKGR